MWLVYVLALVVGGGLMLVQAVSGGHDTVDAGHALDVQHHGGGPGVLSIRSFIYGLFAFGFVGAALHIPRITGRTSALLIALASGVAAGLAAGFTFARLGSAAASGAASLHEAAGRRARVLLPCAADRPGKIRLDLGGQQVDMKATTNGPPIPAGAEVVVVEVREDVALVAPVPLSGGTS
jgi:membrane protein implicated in regulation of membrane protease activity